jgi:hypothetical protein
MAATAADPSDHLAPIASRLDLEAVVAVRQSRNIDILLRETEISAILLRDENLVDRTDPAAPLACAEMADRSRPERFAYDLRQGWDFFIWIRCNPLKSPDSDE